MEVTRCRDCGVVVEELPNRSLRCEVCLRKARTAVHKRWKAKHPEAREKERAAAKRWRAKNPEKRRAWFRSHPESVNATNRKCREKNPEVYRASARRRYERLYRENPDKVLAKARKRQALMRENGGAITRQEITDLLERQQFMCANSHCGVMFERVETGVGYRFHKDHIVPLTKGGVTDVSNIQLLCPRCNVRKANKDPEEWAKANANLF